MAKKKSPKPVHDHGLADLVGKKIKTITLEEIDVMGHQENVRQFYKITCADGDVLFLGCDGGSDDNQYATAQLYDQDEYDDFLESISDDDDEVSEFDNESDEDEDLTEGDDEDDTDDFLGDGPPTDLDEDL